MALFGTLPTPTNDLFPSLMVESCLVLAPDVNSFLNSRKQGLPCWRSLPFLLFHSLEPLKHLGLDPQKVTKLAVKLCAHSVQYAYKLVSTRRALEKTFAASHHRDQEWGIASHPPDPH